MSEDSSIKLPDRDPPAEARRFILEHADLGVFLGVGLGFAFWSNLDDLGATSAPTFPTRADAEKFALDFLSARDPRLLRCLEVVADRPQFQASIEACVRAGAAGWGVWRESSHRGERPGRPH